MPPNPNRERRDDDDHYRAQDHRRGRHAPRRARGGCLRRARSAPRRRELRDDRQPAIGRCLSWLQRLRDRRAGRRRRHRQLRGRAHPRTSSAERVSRRRGRPSQPPAPAAQGQVRPRRRRRGRPGRPGRATPPGQAKTRDGNVEAMRVLRVARSSARRSRTQAINQMRSLISTAAERVASRAARPLHLRGPRSGAAPTGTADKRDIASVTKLHPADCWPGGRIALEEEVKEIDASARRPSSPRPHPNSSQSTGVGTDVASALLVAAGDNPERLQERGDLRPSLRSVADRRQQRQAAPAPTQPQRGPPGQLRAVAHRLHPDGQRPANQRLHRAADEGGSDQEGGDALPQALRRSRGARRSYRRTALALDNP